MTTTRTVDPATIEVGQRYRQGRTTYEVVGFIFGTYTEGPDRGTPWRQVVLANTDRPTSTLRVLDTTLQEETP